MMRSLRSAAWIVLMVTLLGLPWAAAAQVTTGPDMIAAPDTLRFSIRLPSNWQFQTKRGDNVFTDYLVFGDSAQMVQNQLTSLAGVTPQTMPDGLGGWAAMFNQAFWRVSAPTADLQINAFLQSVMVQTELVGQQSVTLGGQYSGAVALVIDRATDTQGYVGAVAVGADGVLGFILGVAPSRDFTSVDPLIQAILNTIRVPAEDGAQTTPFANTGMATFAPPAEGTAAALPVTPSPASPQPTAPTPSELALIDYPMEGLVASISVPGDWIVYDYLAQENVFAFGDTDAAAASRFATVRPDLVQEQPLVGTGGLVMLYNPADVGVDPAAPDLTALLDSVTGRLSAQGYTILKPGTDFMVEGNPGRYALVRGTEYGYVAVILFGEQLAYMTATGTPDTFEANAELLDGILLSLRVPAAEPAPEPTAATGGGIGGLGSASATAAPTAAPGIGGLGG